eukprot:TRINITY_DN37592_c0_g1_i1.p1 TRINITY_DN37592_c0_g1~~TRINITY_DN37592_c0_g1_i1.p1  ORF type:complete len:339 (-),score=2.86 TRINITY_DN37592_c0_g1_i1:141-1157(-)
MKKQPTNHSRELSGKHHLTHAPVQGGATRPPTRGAWLVVWLRASSPCMSGWGLRAKEDFAGDIRRTASQGWLWAECVCSRRRKRAERERQPICPRTNEVSAEAELYLFRLAVHKRGGVYTSGFGSSALCACHVACTRYSLPRCRSPSPVFVAALAVTMTKRTEGPTLSVRLATLVGAKSPCRVCRNATHVVSRTRRLSAGVSCHEAAGGSANTVGIVGGNRDCPLRAFGSLRLVTVEMKRGAVAGALTGAAFGPWGAVAGAAIGAVGGKVLGDAVTELSRQEEAGREGPQETLLSVDQQVLAEAGLRPLNVAPPAGAAPPPASGAPPAQSPPQRFVDI